MSKKLFLGLATLIISLTIASLIYLGRNPICECGYIKLWHGITKSSEQSQHLFDPYTFTHFGHGVLIYFILWLVLRKRDIKTKFLIALGIESLWEVIENTSFVIERYRTATISLDYYGDSIVNSLGDILTMVGGFAFAFYIPVIATIGLFVIIELALGFLIKDNLTLNVVMLLNPSTYVKEWQSKD